MTDRQQSQLDLAEGGAMGGGLLFLTQAAGAAVGLGGPLGSRHRLS